MKQQKNKKSRQNRKTAIGLFERISGIGVIGLTDARNSSTANKIFSRDMKSKKSKRYI